MQRGEQNMPVSLARDIRQMFSPIDVEQMGKHKILLDDYTYMSDPSRDHGNGPTLRGRSSKAKNRSRCCEGE